MPLYSVRNRAYRGICWEPICLHNLFKCRCGNAKLWNHSIRWVHIVTNGRIMNLGRQNKLALAHTSAAAASSVVGNGSLNSRENFLCFFFCRWNGFICNVLILFQQRMNIVVNKRKITNIFWRETKTQIAQTKNHLFKQSRNSCRVEKLETTKRRIEREQNLLGKKHDSKNDAIKTN